MASMGVLASLMQSQYPRIDPYDPMDVARLTSQRTANQTNLLTLEDLKRQQQAEAAYRQTVQHNPGLLFGGGTQPPLLASLSPGGMPPAGGPPGPITQQVFGPGGPGAAQQVPAYPDLSQFAGGPPPVLSSLAASPRPPIPASSPSPQATLMQLARQNPDAARLLQGRMQEQEDLQWKRQEQGLKMREKVAETVGQLLGGAHDQASYDVIRRQLAQVSPEWAAALPQVYSAAGVQPFIDAAISAKDRARLGIDSLQARAEAAKVGLAEQQAATAVPKYTEDSTLNAAIYARMKGQPPGARPSEAIVDAARKDVEEGKVRVSAMQGAGQIKDTPAGAVRIRPSGDVEYLKGPQGEPLHPPPTQAEQSTATFANLARKAHEGSVALETKGFQPGLWEKAAGTLPLGLGNYLTSEEARSYKTHVLDFAQAWLRKTSQGAVTPQEWQMVDELYFPQPGNTKAEVEAKRQKREAVIKELEDESRKTGRTGGQGQPGVSGGQPTSQAPAGGKVVSRADLHAEARRRNISPEQAEQLARQKGYEVR